MTIEEGRGIYTPMVERRISVGEGQHFAASVPIRMFLPFALEDSADSALAPRLSLVSLLFLIVDAGFAGRLATQTLSSCGLDLSNCSVIVRLGTKR